MSPIRPLRSWETSHFTLSVPAYPEHLNELGHIKAGPVIKLVDIAGGICAKKFVGPTLNVVTAALDRTDFKSFVSAWEIVNLDAQVIQVWNTSMEVQVQIHAWNFNTDVSRHIATSYLVMSALDMDRKKPSLEQVPQLILNSPERIQLAQEADLRKQYRHQEGKEVPIIPLDEDTDDPVILERLMTPMHANTMNNVFGGEILAVIHKAAKLAAVRQAQSGTIVGVRQDRMSFIAPVFIGETVRAKAVVTKTWTSSLEIQVEVEAVNPTTWEARHVANSFLVYVRVDAEGKPVPIPPWVPATRIQHQRWEAAESRRQIREVERRALLANAQN